MAVHKLLSASMIKNVRVTGRERWLTDDTGVQGTGRLMLRISRAGARSWFFRLPRGAGRPQHTLSLGPYSFRRQPGALTLSEAREQARSLTGALLAPQVGARLEQLHRILGSALGPNALAAPDEAVLKRAVPSLFANRDGARVLGAEPTINGPAVVTAVPRRVPTQPSPLALQELLSTASFSLQFRARNLQIMLDACRGRTLQAIAAQHGLTSPRCGQIIRRNLSKLAELFLAPDVRPHWLPSSMDQFHRGHCREYWLPLLATMVALAPPDPMPPSIAEVPSGPFAQEIIRTSAPGGVLRDQAHLALMLDCIDGLSHQDLREKYGLGNLDLLKAEELVTQELKAHAAQMNLAFLSNLKVSAWGRTRGHVGYLREVLRLLLLAASGQNEEPTG